MKISIATSVYVNFPVREAIRRIADAGYDGVDIWGGRPHVYREDFSAAGLAEIRRLAEGEGLDIHSFLPAFFRYPHNICSPNEIVRRDTLDYVYRCADNAAALGADYLLVCPGKLLNGQDEAQAWQFMAAGLQAACEYAAGLSLQVVLEPVNKQVFDIINTAADAMRMLAQLNCDNLGVVLDTGHIHLSEENTAQALQAVGERLYQVHVNDNDGVRQQNLVPGEATYDFPALIRQLRERKYEGYLTAELGGDYASNPDVPVRQAAERLREYLQIV